MAKNSTSSLTLRPRCTLAILRFARGQIENTFYKLDIKKFKFKLKIICLN